VFENRGVFDNLCAKASKFKKQYSSKYVFITTPIIWSRSFESGVSIAGETDMILVDKNTGKIVIVDFKTSRKSFHDVEQITSAEDEEEIVNFYKQL